MKTCLFLLLGLTASVSAFAPVKSVKTVSIPRFSSIGFPDDYSDKPLYVPKDTPAKADHPKNWLQRQTMANVMIDPDYILTWAMAMLGFLIMWYHPSYTTDGSPSLIGIFGGGFHLVFAGLLYSQTARVRCVFEKDAFEFYNLKGRGENAELVKKPSNYVSGTENRWKYDSIINYGFFPSIDFPVICYFKETETPPEKWSRWFAAFDSYNRGQPHFFPGICNAKQFKQQCEARGIKHKAIPTLKDH